MIILKVAKKVRMVLLFIFPVMPFLISSNIFAQTPPNLIYSPIISSGLTSPLEVINAGDGTNRLFIVQKGGIVRIVSSAGVLLPAIFLDIHSILSSAGENGLLSMVFHPNYATNGYFFVYYIDLNGNVSISRYRAASPLTNNTVNNATGVVIMTIPQVTTSYHNGGKMNFGPDDNLYFAVGDGSPGQDPNNHAQDGNLLWGKMIRINVDDFTDVTPPLYNIPPDNPYVNDPNVRDEIFALGLRNPWRWSFDRVNNNTDVWITDVGEGAREEVNYVPFASSGHINYGWRCYEGNQPYNTTNCGAQSSYTSPIFTYDHGSTGGHSVTGGIVYRGTEYEALYGYYICTDFISARTWMIKPNGPGWTISVQNGTPGSIVGFGEAENKALYAISLSGTLYKVTTSTGGPLGVTLLQFTAKAFTGYNELKWKTTNEQNLAYYEIEFSTDGMNYINAGKVNAVNTPSENNYSFPHFITAFTKLFYKLKITDKDNRITYSDVVTLSKTGQSNTRIYPTLVTGNRLNIISDKPVEQIALFSADGKNVFQNKLNNFSGSMNISLPHLQNGFYFVKLKLKDGYVNEKILIQQ